MALVAGGGGGDVIPPQSSGGGSISEITSTDSTVTITDPTGPTTNLEVPGAGGIVSITGAGVTTTPGILNQAGGMSIEDDEGDGFSVSSSGSIILANTIGASFAGPVIEGNGAIVTVGSAGVGKVLIGENFAAAVALSDSATSIPLTVAAGVNDTFIYTPVGTGIPETFTVAPGTYATVVDAAAAMGNATGTSSDAFSDYATPALVAVNTPSFAVFGGTIGDTLTHGPTDVLTDLGFSVVTTTFILGCDKLAFFNENPTQQQTVTGALSSVIDPAAKAVLTSLLAALAQTDGYGLVLDGTT